MVTSGVERLRHVFVGEKIPSFFSCWSDKWTPDFSCSLFRFVSLVVYINSNHLKFQFLPVKGRCSFFSWSTGNVTKKVGFPVRSPFLPGTAPLLSDVPSDFKLHSFTGEFPGMLDETRGYIHISTINPIKPAFSDGFPAIKPPLKPEGMSIPSFFLGSLTILILPGERRRPEKSSIDFWLPLNECEQQVRGQPDHGDAGRSLDGHWMVNLVWVASGTFIAVKYGPVDMFPNQIMVMFNGYISLPDGIHNREFDRKP